MYDTANTIHASSINTPIINVPDTTNPIIINSNNSMCNFISLPVKKPTPSNFTSQGKRKATKCDPIKNAEDIERIKQYYLTSGHKNKRLRNYMIFILGVSIGLRGCDLLRLQIRDVMTDNGMIKDRISTFESKTSKTIYPYINTEAKSAIINYLNSLPAIYMDDYLIKDMGIKGKATEPFSEDGLYRIILKAKDALNLPYHLGAHSLRKTFAYWTIKLHPNDNNVLMTLQEMLNHSSPRITLMYSGISDEDHNKMYNDLGDFISNPTNYHTPDINTTILDQIEGIEE